MNNMKLVQELTEAKIAQGIAASDGTQSGYAYAVGCLEVVLSGVLIELEIRNPKTYEGKVQYIKDLIEMSQKETN